MDKTVDSGTLVTEHTAIPGQYEEQVESPARRLTDFRQFGSFPQSEIFLRSGDSNGRLGDTPFPKSIATPLIDMLTSVANNKTVVVISIPREVNIKRVASILNMNRSEMHNLLDEDEISYHKVGGERIVPLTELFDYKRRNKERVRELINELTREAQEMGLYELK